jgi:hypothetical protein
VNGLVADVGQTSDRVKDDLRGSTAIIFMHSRGNAPDAIIDAAAALRLHDRSLSCRRRPAWGTSGVQISGLLRGRIGWLVEGRHAFNK